MQKGLKKAQNETTVLVQKETKRILSKNFTLHLYKRKKTQLYDRTELLCNIVKQIFKTFCRRLYFKLV